MLASFVLYQVCTVAIEILDFCHFLYCEFVVFSLRTSMKAKPQ